MNKIFKKMISTVFVVKERMNKFVLKNSGLVKVKVGNNKFFINSVQIVLVYVQHNNNYTPPQEAMW